MPILSVEMLSGAHVATVACVLCAGEAQVDVEALTLGTEHYASVIELPPCKCGGQEILQRTTDVHPDEGRSGHRKKVNALSEYLRKIGRVYSKHVGAAREMKTPPQIGELVGHVPESSLPEHIVRPKRKLRALNQASATAEASVASTPTPTHEDDPAAMALKLFAMGQKILAGLKPPAPAAAAPAAPAAPAPTESTTETSS